MLLEESIAMQELFYWLEKGANAARAIVEAIKALREAGFSEPYSKQIANKIAALI